MAQQLQELVPQDRQVRNRFLWIAASAIAVLLFIIVFRYVQARARRMLRPPQGTSGVLAEITNSGSTNTPGSTLAINRDGSGTLTYQKGTEEERFRRYVNKTFPAGTFESSELENILTQIKDVGTVPNHDCLKSASFGSTTTITYQGKTSGDISCLSNEDAKIFQDLKDVVQRITSHS